MGGSYDYALTETINGFYKAEVTRRLGPWRKKNRQKALNLTGRKHTKMTKYVAITFLVLCGREKILITNSIVWRLSIFVTTVATSKHAKQQR